MEESKLSTRFKNGLNKYQIMFEELKNWKYCGGGSGRHHNYFKVLYPDDEIPSHARKCLCGAGINENCYITDGKKIIVLGNCCIKRFVPKCTRTCEVCEQPHRNRKSNLCNDCKHESKYFNIYKKAEQKKKSQCEDCGVETDGYKKCFKCFNKGKTFCVDCNKKTDGYLRCYDCHIK